VFARLATVGSDNSSTYSSPDAPSPTDAALYAGVAFLGVIMVTAIVATVLQFKPRQ
jgi:hypothetical protein